MLNEELSNQVEEHKGMVAVDGKVTKAYKIKSVLLKLLRMCNESMWKT